MTPYLINMPRRPTKQGLRGSAPSTPTKPKHITSSSTNPPSQEDSTTYTGEVDHVGKNDTVLDISFNALTLHEAEISEVPPKVAKPKTVKPRPFNFMHLPSELRAQVYGHYFEGTGRVIDLDSDNYKRIHKKLGLLRVCRKIYGEASHLFFSTHTARVFPTHPGRFFKTKKPLLARLKPHQRACLTALELRLGPGWSKPPRGWVVNEALGLGDCANVRSLTVFVECDPSDGVCNGFRRADGFYEGFSRNLLGDVLAGLPQVEQVHFDAWTSVQKNGAMMRAVFEATLAQGRKIGWGPERGWTDVDEEQDVVVTTQLAPTGHMDILVA